MCKPIKKDPAFTHSDTMTGISYEVTRENLNAVRGQYIREQYREEENPKSGSKYIELLKNEQQLITGILNRMAGNDDDAFIEKLKVVYGDKFKENRKKLKQGNRLFPLKIL